MAKFKVYFDGLCVVCSKEINFYRKQMGAHAIEWVDISSPSFSAESEGLDPAQVQRVFHVRDESGQLYRGVDGFIEIWKRLPKLKTWVALSRLPLARPSMQLGYQLFVRLRPYLPRRKGDCADGYCYRTEERP